MREANLAGPASRSIWSSAGPMHPGPWGSRTRGSRTRTRAPPPTPTRLRKSPYCPRCEVLLNLVLKSNPLCDKLSQCSKLSLFAVNFQLRHLHRITYLHFLGYDALCANIVLRIECKNDHFVQNYHCLRLTFALRLCTELHICIFLGTMHFVQI